MVQVGVKLQIYHNCKRSREAIREDPRKSLGQASRKNGMVLANQLRFSTGTWSSGLRIGDEPTCGRPGQIRFVPRAEKRGHHISGPQESFSEHALGYRPESVRSSRPKKR